MAGRKGMREWQRKGWKREEGKKREHAGNQQMWDIKNPMAPSPTSGLELRLTPLCSCPKADNWEAPAAPTPPPTTPPTPAIRVGQAGGRTLLGFGAPGTSIHCHSSPGRWPWGKWFSARHPAVLWKDNFSYDGWWKRWAFPRKLAGMWTGEAHSRPGARQTKLIAQGRQGAEGYPLPENPGSKALCRLLEHSCDVAPPPNPLLIRWPVGGARLPLLLDPLPGPGQKEPSSSQEKLQRI